MPSIPTMVLNEEITETMEIIETTDTVTITIETTEGADRSKIDGCGQRVAAF